MDYQILVIEDQKDISQIVEKYLQNEGYKSMLAEDGFEALRLFSQHAFHVVLLDIMMPGIDGFEVLQQIRKVSDIPIIMLTARADEIDRIKGFDYGADDYVVKPFSPKELMRRIKAIIKRVYPENDEKIIRTGNLRLFPQRMQLLKGEEIIEITATECQLLETFMSHQGQILSREQLLSASFGFDYDGYDRNIDSYIKRLRQKIEDDPKNPKYLLTKYGAGYMFGGGEE